MQVSWIDADEVGALLGSLRDTAPASAQEEPEDTLAALLSQLKTSPRPEAAPAEPAASSPDPAAEAAPPHHPDLHSFRQRLDAIRTHAMEAGLLAREEPLDEPEDEPLPEPQAPTRTAHFHPQGSTVAERLASFIQWAQPRLGGAELYVIGDQGELLWGHKSAHQGLVLTTVMAWVAFTRMSGALALHSSPILRQPMADSGHLMALPCPTRLGLLHIAATGGQPIADDLVPELRSALIRAMEAAM